MQEYMKFSIFKSMDKSLLQEMIVMLEVAHEQLKFLTFTPQETKANLFPKTSFH